MSLWDPEAAGNAAKFLRLSDMELLELRNAPFEGQKGMSLKSLLNTIQANTGLKN